MPWTTFFFKKSAISNAPAMCSSTFSGVSSPSGASDGAGIAESEAENGDRVAEADGMKRLKRTRVC